MSRSKYAVLTFAIALAVCGGALAKGKTARKHCRYGGLSDSRGKVVRCLTRAEAEQLSAETENADPPQSDEEPKKSLPSVDVRATFQQGKTGVAKQRLASNSIVYARCVADHGGLKRAQAEVRIRFHVTPKGRARDVSISRRRNVAPAAARCIADAINGSFVGVPADQPTVGTAVLRMR